MGNHVNDQREHRVAVCRMGNESAHVVDEQTISLIPSILGSKQ
jgi:hypothetical protein